MLQIFQAISADIQEWKPNVADIRSSKSSRSHLSADEEQMCDRISSAMDHWSSVCDRVPRRIADIAAFLMTNDGFRLNLDDLFGRIVDVRKELRNIDSEISTSKRSSADDCQFLKQLTVCEESELYVYVLKQTFKPLL